MSKQIQIEITGRAHVGKTMISAIIVKALKEAGFTSVSINNPEGDFRVLSDLVKEDRIPDKVKETPVMINDLNRQLVTG